MQIRVPPTSARRTIAKAAAPCQMENGNILLFPAPKNRDIPGSFAMRGKKMDVPLFSSPNLPRQVVSGGVDKMSSPRPWRWVGYPGRAASGSGFGRFKEFGERLFS